MKLKVNSQKKFTFLFNEEAKLFLLNMPSIASQVFWSYYSCNKYEYIIFTVEPCLGRPCLHGGTCSTVEGDFQCACATGYDGSRCENVDDCLSNVNSLL